MTEPKTIGNRATEQGEAESGADYAVVNQGGPENPSPLLEVEVKENPLGTFLIPVNGSAVVHKQASSVHFTDQDLAMAQITSDEGVIVASKDRLARVSKREAREALVWYKTPAGFSAAYGDRILVRRDTLEDSYSCSSCKGSGKSEAVCPMCNGLGNTCAHCLVLGYRMSTKYSSGKKPCEPCRGSGWAGGIVIPDQNQSVPIAGIVVSIGPDCKMTKLGDRVMFSMFAGHTWSHRGGETTVMMREHEILNLLTENPFESQ